MALDYLQPSTWLRVLRHETCKPEDVEPQGDPMKIVDDTYQKISELREKHDQNFMLGIRPNAETPDIRNKVDDFYRVRNDLRSTAGVIDEAHAERVSELSMRVPSTHEHLTVQTDDSGDVLLILLGELEIANKFIDDTDKQISHGLDVYNKLWHLMSLAVVICQCMQLVGAYHSHVSLAEYYKPSPGEDKVIVQVLPKPIPDVKCISTYVNHLHP